MKYHAVPSGTLPGTCRGSGVSNRQKYCLESLKGQSTVRLHFGPFQVMFQPHQTQGMSKTCFPKRRMAPADGGA